MISTLLTTSEAYIPILLQTGIAGVMLLWFMTKHAETLRIHNERIDALAVNMSNLENRLNKMANAILLEVCTRDNLSISVREQAKKLLDDQT